MSERTEALAKQFEQENNALIQTIESLSDAQWQAKCSDEGWSVGVTAHHVAGGDAQISGLVQVVAAGQPAPPITIEMINEGNAKHAHDFAGCTKAETLAMLRQNAQSAAASLRALSDDQLQHSTTVLEREMNVEQLIQMILIGHVQQHGASIRKAL